MPGTPDGLGLTAVPGGHGEASEALVESGLTACRQRMWCWQHAVPAASGLAEQAWARPGDPAVGVPPTHRQCQRDRGALEVKPAAPETPDPSRLGFFLLGPGNTGIERGKSGWE